MADPREEEKLKFLDYDELVKQIKNKADTQIPALMIVCMKECIRRKVFKPGGLLRVVKKILEEEESN